jgi:hypothetical protein
MFTSYSHHTPSLPASGLRLETASNIDKKKSELYFSSPVKKTLTEKSKSTLPQATKSSRPRAGHSESFGELTSLAHTRIFFSLQSR